MTGAIDIVVNLRTPEVIAAGLSPTDSNFQEKTRQTTDTKGGLTIDDYLRVMDEAGIERSLLIAVRCGPASSRHATAIPYQWVHDICENHPDRFSGLAGIDPTLGMQQLRELEYAVKELGFVGAHSYPHWFSLPPDEAQWYPVYAKCCELEVPIMMQVGQNLIYQKDVRLPSVARPVLLDKIAIDFPELKQIGIHIGVPWAEEMVFVARKHPNVFIGGDAYAPRYWPDVFVNYAASDGAEKCLYGSDWPVIDPRRAMREIAELPFGDHARRALLRDNAMQLFGLPS